MIGPSIEIKGDMVGGEDLHIEGRVEGKIDLRRNNVSIGKNGRVQADVYGRVISVEGEVQGNLHGDEQIILKQSSTVRGNLTAPRVSLEDGSNFKGSIDMTPKQDAGKSALGLETRAPAAAPKPQPPSGGPPAGSAVPRPGV
ncbi:MAG: polymer-forming cytoskeletal protein [Acidobacteriota bacterium]